MIGNELQLTTDKIWRFQLDNNFWYYNNLLRVISNDNNPSLYMQQRKYRRDRDAGDALARKTSRFWDIMK